MLIGIDEAGRGAWAGPMTAAAVCLLTPINGLKDSKLLSARKRAFLSLEIKQQAFVGVGWVTSKEIDQYGLTKAQQLCMERALRFLPKDIAILVDGHINYLAHLPNSSCLINADASVQEVAAASIIAKTMRDSFMSVLAEREPNYEFVAHVGYGTSLHLSKLKQYGVSQYHRLSYKPIQLLQLGAV